MTFAFFKILTRSGVFSAMSSSYEPQAHQPPPTILRRWTYLLHESVCNRHSRKLRTPAVRPFLTVPTETRDFAKVEVELLDKPVNGVA